eukprot:8542357-Pyramimonas_sp.AAC.2
MRARNKTAPSRRTNTGRRTQEGGVDALSARLRHVRQFYVQVCARSSKESKRPSTKEPICTRKSDAFTKRKELTTQVDGPSCFEMWRRMWTSGLVSLHRLPIGFAV